MTLSWIAFEGAFIPDAGRPLAHVGRLASLALSIALTLAVRRRKKPSGPSAA